jgi:predicted aspartyl protease
LAADIVNLHFILNGDPFLVLIRLQKNGEAIQIKALMDTGAQAWLLGNQKLCELLVKRWRLPRIIHDHSAIIKKLENKPIQTIRNFIPVSL